VALLIFSVVPITARAETSLVSSALAVGRTQGWHQGLSIKSTRVLPRGGWSKEATPALV
jgi:hypothetical protein